MVPADAGLVLDTVRCSDSALGRPVPDGGYGWTVLLAAALNRLFLPSLLVSYAVFYLAWNVEFGDPSVRVLNSSPVLYAAVFFVSFNALADPWSRLIVANSVWPRLTHFAGLSFVTAGMLLYWLALHRDNGPAVFVASGALVGVGSSLCHVQCEVSVGQYFRIKLPGAVVFLEATRALGCIFMPLLLVYVFKRTGLAHLAMAHYVLVLLQGIVVTVLLRRPAYLSFDNANYSMLYNTPGSVTTVQNREMEDFNEPQSNFQDVPADASIPRPLHQDDQINSIFSFHNSPPRDQTEIYSSLSVAVGPSMLRSVGEVLKRPTFYKSVVLHVTTKLSIMLYALGAPLQAYYSLNSAHITDVVQLMALSYLPLLIVCTIVPCVSLNKNGRTLALSAFSMVGALGFLVLSKSHSAVWLISSGFIAVIATAVQDGLGYKAFRDILQTDTNSSFLLLNTLTGGLILLILTCDFTIQESLLMVSLLNFVTSSIWMSNYIYKCIKSMYA